jgi:cysteine sulfinate desulfinase/cysteine desulfurase-like protein
MSISKYTTDEEINYVLKELPKIVEKLRRISPLVN